MSFFNNLKELSLEECRQYLPLRSKEAHKGDFGHLLIVGGDYGMGGSVRLAGEAALRSGAGLVSIATRKEHAFAILGASPELMCYGIENAEDLNPLLEKASVVVLGPGLGKKHWGKNLFQQVIKTNLPIVLDADGLNLLAEFSLQKHNWILTPHPGEAATLLNLPITTIQKDRVSAIQLLQHRYRGIPILKGSGTLVLGNLDLPVMCSFGNPGMAIPGTGDLLAGIIGALIAQGLPLYEAATLGVVVHGLAGDAAAKKGERGMLARDLLKEIQLCLN